MQKIILMLLLLLLCMYRVSASDQVTVINTKQNFDFRQYGLMANVFTNENLSSTLRVCESIDNSKFCLVGPQTNAQTLNTLFAKRAVRTSLKELLQRGGIIYFSTTSWGVISRYPESMNKFFKEINIKQINSSNYKGFSNNKPITVYPVKEEKKNPLLREPNNLFDGYCQTAIRYLPNLSKDWNVLFASKDGKYPVTIVQECIGGNGKIIVSFATSTFSQAKDKFIANILTLLYGPRQKISGKEKIMQKYKMQPATSKISTDKVIFAKRTNTVPKIDGILDSVWKKAAVVKLREYKKQTAPQKTTTVRIMNDKRNLYLFYSCNEPQMRSLKKKVVQRDGQVWNDDCVEFVVSPQKNDLRHIIISSGNVVYDAKNGGKQWEPSFKHAVKHNPNSWCVEMAIPLEEIGLDVGINKFCKVNFCREEKQLKELSSWHKASGGFTNPLSLGYLSFVSQSKFEQAINSYSQRGKKVFKDGYVLWTDNPLRRKFSDTMPDKLVDVKNIKLTVARNEKECISVLLSNLSDEALTFRIEPQFYLSGTKSKFQKMFILKQTVPRMTHHLAKQFDPIVRLNEGNIITVPSYETRELWLDVKTTLPAGKYNWSLGVIPTDSQFALKKIDFTVNVLSLTFPKVLPVDVCLFGPYKMTYASNDEIWEEYIKVASRDYHVNISEATAPKPKINRDKNGKFSVSGTKEDFLQNAMICKKYGKFEWSSETYFGIETQLKKFGIEFNPDNPEHQKLLEEIFQKLMKYAKEEGIDCEDFYIKFKDELYINNNRDVDPKDSPVRELVSVIKIIKSVNPKIRMLNTIATWTSLKTLRELVPVIDVVSAWEPRVTTRSTAKAELAIYKKYKVKLFPYLCSMSIQTNNNLDYFRFRGIRDWMIGADGIFLWAFNSWRNNDWNAFDYQKSNKAVEDYCMFYHGDIGPIPSVRLEAFREGIEDFYLLKLAKEKLLSQKDPKLSRITSKSYLKKLMKSDAPEKVAAWRTKLLKRLDAID